MTITIKIDTGNAAFSGGNRNNEVRRIVDEAIEIVKEALCGPCSLRLFDYNGNAVGTLTVTGK